MRIEYSNLIGNTPLMRINNKSLNNINLYTKLEGFNVTGSIKDRAAKYVLNKLLDLKKISHDTTIIESSSGNMGIALANYCKYLGLKCKIVIDPNILLCNERRLKLFGAKVHKVFNCDDTGSFLTTRLKVVNEYILQDPQNYYWINQYKNPYVAEAYYSTIGEEICNEVNIDYVFIGVSSGGTITGISNKVKQCYPTAKVIAVDTVGSLVFGEISKKRVIPGIGSSIHPSIIDNALIDDIVLIEESEAISGCYSFLEEQSFYIGGSAGSVYSAIIKYFSCKKLINRPNVIAIFADRGEHYLDTIYNDSWVKTNFK